MKQQYRHTKPLEKLQSYKKTIDDQIDKAIEYHLQRNRKLKKTFNKWSRKSFCRNDLGARAPPPAA